MERYFNLRGRKWPVHFDMKNVRELQEYLDGDLRTLPQAVGDPEKYAAIVSLAIGEGVRLARLEGRMSADVQPPTPEQVAMQLGWEDIRDPANTEALLDAFSEFFGKNVLSPASRAKLRTMLTNGFGSLTGSQEPT